VQQIPQESHQNTFSKLSTSGFTFHGALITSNLRMPGDWVLLAAAYQVWSDLVNDQNILPHDVSEVDKTFWLHSRGHQGEYMSMPNYLLSVLREGHDTKFVDGKRLAGMASGRLALVPESAQEGDTIAIIHGHGDPDTIRLHYLFHPIQPKDDYSSIDDRISWSAKQIEELKGLEVMIEKLKGDLVKYPGLKGPRVKGGTKQELSTKELMRYEPKLTKLKRLEVMTEEFEALERPMLHCRFIGECFTREDSLLEPQEYNPSKSIGIIVAIH
jgi:hypothetical protein